jgi:hypothetical protein
MTVFCCGLAPRGLVPAIASSSVKGMLAPRRNRDVAEKQCRAQALPDLLLRAQQGIAAQRVEGLRGFAVQLACLAQQIREFLQAAQGIQPGIA